MARHRKITSHDVARQAGVSRTTVSYVLNNVEAANISEMTRQRVLDAATLLGYVPNAAAQMLAGQRSRIVGLVFPRTDPHLATHLFLLQVMDGLMRTVENWEAGCWWIRLTSHWKMPTPNSCGLNGLTAWYSLMPRPMIQRFGGWPKMISRW
ncbi:MAG: LacI family DNA-binding transcriptional regulator [Caldilineaceae bacterium]